MLSDGKSKNCAYTHLHRLRCIMAEAFRTSFGLHLGIIALSLIIIVGSALAQQPKPNKPKPPANAATTNAAPTKATPAKAAPAEATPAETAPAKAPPAKPAPVVKAVPVIPSKNIPADATNLIDLPKLSTIEITEISDRLALHLESTLGYTAVSSALPVSLPAPPAGIIAGRTITRTADAGTHILRFGYRRYISQPPQLWVQGVIVNKAGLFVPNTDLPLVEPEITKMIASLNEMRAGLTVRDLEPKLIQLSYVDADTAIAMLKVLGITTVASAAAVPAKVDFNALPYVIKIEDPKPTYTGLIGAKGGATGGNFGLSMSPGVATDMSDNAIATPMTQLLVMFHPAHPEQFSEVRSALDDYIDRPARQIFIEAMVLEISEQGLKDLGVDWTLNPYSKDDGTAVITELRGGSTSTIGFGDTLNATIPNLSTFHNVFTGEFQWDWKVTLRALITEDKAEVLSRPSILTLNNRQSTIRVGKDIPIASSLQGSNYSSISAFKFQYLSTGILLNIRPRINEAGTEVTMLIDTVVSAPVPGEDMVMLSGDGKTVLAKAPTVSTRRVQTYSRIANNTPLIIGGLVANEKISKKHKVPLLGDIPILGALFRSERTETEKREVIIVLTPHVLPEKREVRRSFPKDEDFFDSFGHNLFRDSYRIRSEDVFDLTFLLENQRIVTYRGLAREAAVRNFRLAEHEPFRSFVADSIPGESILVTRMIYEVIKRLNCADKIDQSRIIYFGSQKVGGYSVKFLDELIKGSNGDKVKDFGDKALAITYHYDRASLEEGRLGSEPIPDIELIDCPDRKAWGTKLWELNQPTPDGRQRHTILIQNESDVLRLRRALALKKITVLNGDIEHLRLKNFSVGKVLLMPDLKKEQIHVVDADTAMFFFHTEHYYAATLSEIEEQLQDLDKMLRRPEIKMLLDTPIPGVDRNGK